LFLIEQPRTSAVRAEDASWRNSPPLQKLADPTPSPVASRIKEIHELGSAMNLAQRTIRSFARFVPKEIVRGVMDKSVSAELGGVREEVTVVFTDVRDFTTIAESADPDMLMRQMSRYFSVLTEAFLAEGGTVDKFIGDAVMSRAQGGQQ
jgi:adenylate cyclase